MGSHLGNALDVVRSKPKYGPTDTRASNPGMTVSGNLAQTSRHGGTAQQASMSAEMLSLVISFKFQNRLLSIKSSAEPGKR